MKILFVCSRNKWRSRTAENIFKNNGIHLVRSAGTESSARIKISINDLIWADKILAMEDIHKEKIRVITSDKTIINKIEVLGINDNYEYMDKELIEILKASTIELFSK